MENLELLAPCGNLENFETAINHKANAVYLGLNDFNARAKADNFNRDNFRNIVKKAHLFDTKVYLTVNTIITNNEIDKLTDLIKFALSCNVDAFIIQDLAVATIIKTIAPNAVLHASTQLGVHNLYGAKILEDLGFKRVVLSRETKLEDIQLIKEKTNLEIEYFVHGALCVAFSGNCYFSSLKFGESGNRGKCLQLCRLPYSAYQNNTLINQGFLLSPSDLCLINNLKLLKEAGVTSLKIEGRLKRAGYVAQTLDSYNKALEYLEKNKTLNSKIEIEKLKNVFSRGDFNEYAYLFQNKIINYKTNNHIGTRIGKVLSVSKFKNLNKIKLSIKHHLSIGDGLKFMKDNKETCSMGVGNYDIEKDYYIVYSKSSPNINDDVYLTLNKAEDDKLLNIKRKIDIVGEVFAKENKPLQIKLKSKNSSINYLSNYICQTALNKPTTCKDIETQIVKTNDTPFYFTNLKITADKIFIPKSIINELRREALIQLENTLIENFEKDINNSYTNIDIKLNKREFNENRNIVCFNDLKMLPDIKKLDNNSNIICYSPLVFKNAHLDILKIKKELSNYQLALNLPIIAFSKDLEIIDDILEKNNDLILIVNNIYGLYYSQKGYKIICGTGLNIANNTSLSTIKNYNIITAIQSVELPKDKFLNDNVYTYSFGYFPLMTLTHCPFKILYDYDECKKCKYTCGITYKNQKDEYLLRRYQLSSCYFELLNSTVINILYKHNKNNFIDLREIEYSKLNEIIQCINESSYKNLLENENLGNFLKEFK